MRRHIVFVAVATALLASPALAETTTPSVAVSGEATMSVTPDVAQIEAGVTTEAKTAREASDANNKAMGVVLLALKGKGIAEKDFQTAQLSLQPQSTTQSRPGPNVLTGYRATNRVTIKVRDILKVADTVDALVGAGANEIGGINFSVSLASKLLDDARAQAVADARRRAEIYAQAIGMSLGAPISVVEEGSPPPMVFRKMAVGMASPTPIAPGEQTLRVGVSVVYELKPKAP